MNIETKGKVRPIAEPDYMDARIATLKAVQRSIEKPEVTISEIKEALQIVLREYIHHLEASVEY
ncbi:hypothetical protein FHX15_004595 [Rhizobium sp. BK650]|uniref:hypothetical protein n=1 Tax=Rhizobium sp. BK650 TaxID=2586990 RepID=UPI0016151313|nr:hypothetical protein [Rhizobium sp. BK650]MBB3659331.1 hypothetical protein [Rhizobium sp. BK650]